LHKGNLVLEQQLQEEFAGRLRAEVADRLADFAPGTSLISDTALAEIMLGYLEEAGLVSEHDLCPYEDTEGRNRCRVIAYALPEGSDRLEIFTAQLLAEDETFLGTDDLSRLAGRAARFFGYAAAGDFSRFVGNDAASNAARHVADELKRIEEVSQTKQVRADNREHRFRSCLRPVRANIFVQLPPQGIPSQCI
jgi:hypothetical protein